MKHFLTFALLASAPFLNADGAHHEHDDHDHEAEEAHDHDHEHEGGGVPVEISERVKHSLKLNFETVSPVRTSHRIYYGGIIVPHAAFTVSTAPVAGTVKLRVNTGTRVAVGDIIYTIASPVLPELRAELETASAELVQGENEIQILSERIQNLKDAGTRSADLECELKLKTGTLRVLKAKKEQAEAVWKAACGGNETDPETGELLVRAKIAGTVQSLESDELAWTERGAAVLRIVKDATLEFSGEVFGNDDFSGCTGTLVVEVSGVKMRLPGRLRTGTQTDPATRSRKIYFTPESVPAGVFAGQLAYVEVAKMTETLPDDDEQTYFVSNSAVIRAGTENYVFVCEKDSETHFFARKVTVVDSRRGLSEVRGLREGEKIVSKGGQELKLLLPEEGGNTKKSIGHFHADGVFHEGEEH